MKPRTLALLLSASFFLGACSSLNPFATGVKAGALKPIDKPVSTSEIWRVKVGDSERFVLKPAVVEKAVFAASADGRVVRIEGGREVWRSSLRVTLSAGVGSDGRIVVVSTPKGEVIALDASNGQERWRIAVNGEVLAAAAVSDNLVVVRSTDSRLFGLDPADGRRRWVYQRAVPALSLRNAAGVVMEGSAIFAGFPGGKLVAVSPANGTLLWEGTVAVPRGATELERVSDITSLPVLTPRAGCAAAYQGRIACFDLSNGSNLWNRELSSSRGLDIDARNVFVTDEKGAVHALDLSNGASLWKQDQLAGRNPGRPLAFGEFVVVADREGVVHFLRKEDGALVGRHKTDASPVLADLQRSGESLLLQTKDGSVYALGVQ